MLTSRILLRRHASSLKCTYSFIRRYTKAVEESDNTIIDDTNFDVKLEPLPTKNPMRQPYMKNLFVAEVDHEILTYPEIKNDDRHKQFEEWLAPIKEYINQTFDGKQTDENEPRPHQVAEKLGEFGVFRSTISQEYNGIGLSAIEYAKLVEVVSKSPALGSYLFSRMDPIAVLMKYGNEEQKKKIIPRIVSGELIPAFAYTEQHVKKGFILNGTATRTSCEKFWKLNTEKIHVPNGNEANCFLVPANFTETEDPWHRPTLLGVFLAERERGGISSSNNGIKMGQQGLETCTVTLKEVILPKENLLGQLESGSNIMLDVLFLGKHNVGSQVVALLKNFINLLTEHIIHSRHYDKSLMDYNSAKGILGKMSLSLYAIESMTYLTAGLIDQYQDQDCSLESAIVEAYSIQECISRINEGMQLIGKESYLKSNCYEKIYRDALALPLWNQNTLDLITYIATIGLQHSGSENASRVKKYRNPFVNSKFILKDYFFPEEGPDLALEEYLHPSLQEPAKLLQKSIHMLAASTEELLVKYGASVSDEHLELQRIAEIAMDIYAMTASLGRASRSHCIGLRHSDQDIISAASICWMASKRVEINMNEILEGKHNNCDDFLKGISEKMFKNHGYFPEHPLQRNF
ncbi:complex I assembly factor ACAD9, mitochondrial [Athalia rosae]|uniref:complex I assembly factor ACAD9, mitochondrial n=1 Tax=Athalia rosae TaxID=37344 RepID=UPI002033A0A4|nr:complex I assembly factor ACAD9, mitochondrial [Athalia rosae]